MNEQRLKNRTAFITGSVQGIGLGVAKCLAGAGANVAIHGLAGKEQSEATLAVLREAGAGDVIFFDTDLRDEAAISEMLEKLTSWNHIDILVNNAGMQITTSLADATGEIWNDILAVNLSAAFHTMRFLMPKMAKHGYGRVINIASVHGLVASVNKAPYVASKFGLVGLSKVAALEYAAVGSKASGGVTVNCINPGWTETQLIQPQIDARSAEFGGDREKGVAALLAEKQPSRRTSDPSEIGELCLWLCSKNAHNITGTSIPVDGGWTAQ
ncbi:MAG: 3-hydroxybutyrate dehydrogenase [Devosiaceae bacterium]|nr:3-hydroxybutyrate dehydrogenase [Devosiaceae bacterium]